MTVVDAADTAPSLTALLALVRRGESVLFVEDGEPVARMGPPGEPSDEEDAARPWRGVFADLVAAPVVKLPPEPPLPPRRTTGPDLGWLPDRGADDE